MRRLSSLLVLPLLAAAAPAESQVADLSRATCGQLLALSRSDQGQLLLWLHGYYAGAAQRTALDRAKVNEAAEGMLKACQGRADLPLMGAEARDVFLGNAQPQVHPSGTGVTVTPGTPPATGAATTNQAQPSAPAPSPAQPSSPAVPRPVR